MSQYPKQTINSGFVNIVDAMGTDATVVNAARVSFGKSVTTVDEKDKKLLKYLADHNHHSPYRHIYVQFHVKAPEVVARQWYKHIVGSEYSFKDQPWNEISGRYVEYSVDNYIPAKLRAQSKDKKQGSSSEELPNEKELLEKFKDHIEKSMEFYKYLCDNNVAKEMARMVLPLTFYTEWYWTASLQAIAHFVKLRNDPTHAQQEIVEYAAAIDSMMETLYPNAWVLFMKSNP